jgi:hypothetical protein
MISKYCAHAAALSNPCHEIILIPYSDDQKSELKVKVTRNMTWNDMDEAQTYGFFPFLYFGRPAQRVVRYSWDYTGRFS